MVAQETAKLELKVVGDSTMVVIPDDVLVQWGAKSGDSVFLVKTPEGWLISPQNPEVARQIQFGREGMQEFRETFRRLAQ